VADTHDRRSFFKQLLRGAAETAQEVTQAFQDVQGFDDGTQPDPFGLHVGSDWQQRAVPAPPATATATEDDLRRLAEMQGLATHVVELLQHATPSVRLTQTGASERTRLGGAPELPEGFEWPSWREQELAFVGQLDLEEIAALGVDTGLPKRGLLLVFGALDSRPSGLQPSDRGAVRFFHVDGELTVAPERETYPPLPLALSVEVTLPSESAGLPPELGFGPFELDAWQRIREGLAELQGVELEDRSVEWHALHRLGGHPDTTEEGMQLDAQLAANGIDLNSGERWYHPRVAELEQGAKDWRLLLQVSTDDALGIQLGYPLGRLYAWIREDDLRAGRFDDVWTFVR
jgi:uncharacterized protein YwqG